MINGGLFTLDFLIEGIRETEPGPRSLRRRRRYVRASALFQRFHVKAPTEAVTEKDLIYPLLSHRMGRSRLRPAQCVSERAGRRARRASVRRRGRARPAPRERRRFPRFQHGLASLRPSDGAGSSIGGEGGKEPRRNAVVADAPLSPSGRRHHERPCVGVSSLTAAFGGSIFKVRFPSPKTSSKSISARRWTLPGSGLDLLDERPEPFADDASWSAHAMRLFLLMFRREAFLPGEAGQTFHDFALHEGKALGSARRQKLVGYSLRRRFRCSPTR